MKLNHIYIGDCTSILEEVVQDSSIDLVYADPPYNMSNSKLALLNNGTGGPYRKINESWDRFTAEEYWQLTTQWMGAAHRALKPGGSMYISCSMHNIGEIIVAGKTIGLKLNNVIVWQKSNAMPSITKRTFTHSAEYVCWFVNGKNWKYNYSQMKLFNPERSKSGEPKQMPDYIKLPLVQGAERLKGENGRALHPAQKPERLLEIIITASSDPGDVVLDPFIGSGTTAVVADRLGRKWVGIEEEARYVQAARRRLGRMES